MTVDRVAALVSSTAVLIVVIAAFLMIGSPAEQRLKRLDERRVADLRQLAWAVDAYWAERETLPGTLEALVDGRRLTQLPTDPADAGAYDYTALNGQRYRLCARFDLASEPELSEDFWAHEAGVTCYVFEASDTASALP